MTSAAKETGASGAGSVEIRSLTRDEIPEAIGDLARLRITVFRDYPYLYDGDQAYEENYLKAYETSDAAMIVVAIADGRIVGAATGTPLADHHEEFADAFASASYDMDKLFYCAESVLLAEWRGHGLGHVFFDRREDHARRLGFTHCCFCGVIRPDDHPARPADYRPLDDFWAKRGYSKIDGVTTGYHWKDIGGASESEKRMQFWIREL